MRGNWKTNRSRHKKAKSRSHRTNLIRKKLRGAYNKQVDQYFDELIQTFQYIVYYQQ